MRKQIMTVLMGAALALMLVAGCATIDKNADPIVVRAERFQTTARATFDFVLNLDESNRDFYRTNVPPFHEFTERLRERIPWSGTNLQRVIVMQLNVQNAKKVYKLNRDTNAFAIALKVGEEAVIQAESWSNIFTIRK